MEKGGEAQGSCYGSDWAGDTGTGSYLTLEMLWEQWQVAVNNVKEEKICKHPSKC